MKLKLILLLLVNFITSAGYSQFDYNDCDRIIITPSSPKPSFEEFLAGVRYVTILDKPKINGHIPAFNALFQYLIDMGFTGVDYLDESYVPPSNYCEEALIGISFDYDLQKFWNITWKFSSSCLDYTWSFTTFQSVKSENYDISQINFYNLLRSTYPYQKPEFNSKYTLKKENKTTCWTENKIIEYLRQNGHEEIEGIYENSPSSQRNQYKVVVKKINNSYFIIYLSGAKTNAKNWKEGDIKAMLESTETPNLYKAQWIMADKTQKSGYYVSFEQGLFKLISLENETDIFIKLSPNVTENINSPYNIRSSGTGFAISSDGYIATNFHVTSDSTKIRVRGINGDFSKSYSAKVVTGDRNNDLAIIKIDDPNFTNLGTIPYTIANTGSDVGTSIFVLGYPLRATMGDEIKLTNGIISSRSGFLGDITSYQISAPVQPGNSGGPLFDNKGSLIGIVNAKHLGAENVFYAIKSSYLLNLIDFLPSRPQLQTINQLSEKSLTEQVKSIDNFIYIIEVN